MKSVVLICLFYIATITNIKAQQPFFKTYDWEVNPSYSNEGFANENMASIKEKIVTEFYFDDEGGLVEYFLEHKVYYLNSDETIEAFNKVYLPYASDSKLELNKARVITKSGELINLDESKILTATNKETNKTYKYFAFEGVEKGSFIEYLYAVKRYPIYKGKRIDFQSEFTKNNVDFDVFAPNNLVFKFKSYNGLTNMQLDTLSETKNHWFLKIPKVKPLEKEELSAYNANKKYIIYALDQNTASRVKDISSYANVAQNIYNFYNDELSKKTQSELKQFLKQIDFKTDDAIDTKLRAIENYIKTNIFIADANSEKLSSLTDVLKDKVANQNGATKLYVAILNFLEIDYELIYTCGRDYMPFDKDFEADNFLTDLLLYFPKSDKYLSPNENDSRYGFPPAYLTDTYGLFIKEVSLGNFKSAIGKIQYIKPITAENTIDKMIINVSFNKEDLANIIVNLDKSMTGYYAMYMHPFMDLIKPENKDELVESYAKSLDEDVEISKKTIKNESPKLFGIKPLEFIIDFTSNAFVEKAGRKYLFSVGELIGRQSEMYQEKERTLPVENEFERSYIRTINVTIPEGYVIPNLDDININNVYSKNGKELLSFKSSYTINGNILSITANEYYRINHIDKSMYQDFRSVINSAADFNKITLVLEPQ